MICLLLLHPVSHKHSNSEEMHGEVQFWISGKVQFWTSDLVEKFAACVVVSDTGRR